MLFNGLPISYIELYNISLWGATFKTHLNKLFSTQRKVVRAIVGATYNAHTNKKNMTYEFLN